MMTISNQPSKSAKLSVLNEIGRAFKGLLGLLKEESISIPHIYEQIYMWAWEQPGWIDLVDIFLEESNQTFFAVFSKDGLLYRAELSITGQEISVGNLLQVK